MASYATLFDFLQQGILFARAAPGGALISDFVNTYVSARLSRQSVEAQGAKPDIYDRQLQDRTLRPLVAPLVPGKPFYTQYPPYYFAIVLPLAWLTMTQSWFVFAVIGVVGAIFSFKYAASEILEPAGVESLAATNSLTADASAGSPGAAEPVATEPTARESGSKDSPSTDPVQRLLSDPIQRGRLITAICIILGLSTYPMWLSIELGQQALLFFPCLVAFWYFLRKKRFWLAGVVAALASVKLQYLPALGIIGLVVGGWQFVLACAGSLLVLLLYAGLLLGWGNIVHYPQALFSGESGANVSGVNADAMQNLRGELFLFFNGDTQVVHNLAAAAFVLSLVVLAWLWRLYVVSAKADTVHTVHRIEETERFNFLVSLSILLMVMFSLHAHTQDYLYVAISCIWLSHFAHKQIASGHAGGALLWIQRLCIWFPLLSWVMLFLLQLSRLTHIQPFFCWAVIVAVCCFMQLKSIHLCRSGS